MSTFIPATVNATTNPTVFGFYVGDAWDRNLELDNQTILNLAGLPQSMLVQEEFTLQPNDTDLFNALLNEDYDADEFAMLCYLGAKQMNWEPSAEFDTEEEAVAFVNGMAAIRWDSNASRYLGNEFCGSSLVYINPNKSNITKQLLATYVTEAFDLVEFE